MATSAIASGTQPEPNPGQATHIPRRFCARPFEFLEVGADGTAYVCCPSWLPKALGNVQAQSVSELWTGDVAKELRRSIVENTFEYCTGCPFLKLKEPAGSVRYVDDFEAAERTLVDAVADGSKGPSEINLAYDRTCNLACRTCREKAIAQKCGPEYERLSALQARLFDQGLLSKLGTLYISGSGEPLASRLYLTLLRSIDPAQYPNLRIRLHTNALLFGKMWEDRNRGIGKARSSVREVWVSIDAASPATYARNRRRGGWEILRDNLSFIRTLRQSGPIEQLLLQFVVQANNFAEMPAFVDLGAEFHADCVYFGMLRNWDSPLYPGKRVFSDEQYAKRAVHLAGHPEYDRFREVLHHQKLARCQDEPENGRPKVVIGDIDGGEG